MKIKKTRVFFALLKNLKSDYRGIMLIAFLSIATVCLGASLPYFIGIATETTIKTVNGIAVVDFQALYPLLVILLFLGVLAPIISWFIAVVASRVSYRFVVKLRIEVFNKIHDLKLKHIDQRQIGELSSLMINDLELVIDGLTHLFTMLIASLLTITASIVMMFVLEYKLASIIILIAIAAIIITLAISRQTFKAMSRAQIITAQYYAFTNEMITASRIVNVFNYEAQSEKKAQEINRKLQKARQKAMFFATISNPISRLINNITYFLVGLIGGLTYIKNPEAIKLGTITSLLLYANQFAKPLTEITNISTETQNALVACHRVFTFLQLQDEHNDQLLPAINKIEGQVSFDQVYFQYVPDRPLIQNFNLSVNKGQVIAIVGPTGAGKSTLVNLLMRFYDLNSGQILVDNKNIGNYNKASVRRRFGMVLQETWLKNATIKENLLYGNNNVSEEKMLEITKLCRVHDFIARLPEGYDTIVTEVSYRVSQGEKQLITIARAMLTNPDVLILDEATSAVDTRTELLIQEALENIMKGKTTFIIAHRLSTIVNADKILVLNNGQIVEIGNHNELLANQGFYYNLYNSQFKSQQ